MTRVGNKRFFYIFTIQWWSNYRPFEIRTLWRSVCQWLTIQKSDISLVLLWFWTKRLPFSLDIHKPDNPQTTLPTFNYSEGLNTNLVWHLNGWKEVGCQMVWFQKPFRNWSNGILLVFLCTGLIFEWLV